jgi:hypothetical protein
MSNRLKSLLLSAFAFLLLSLPAFGQMTAMEGDVKGADGKPLVKATCQIRPHRYQRKLLGQYGQKRPLRSLRIAPRERMTSPCWSMAK